MHHLTLLAFFTSTVCQAQWTQLPDFPGTPRDDAAAFTVGGKIYVGTGYAVGWVLMNDWFCYDPDMGTWTTITPLPADPRQYCTTFTLADTGYVFGGQGPNGALDELWAYHPATDQWEQKASLPAEGRYACAGMGMMWADAIIATGILASGVPTNEAWKYNSQTNSWTATGDVPGPPRHRAASVRGSGEGLLLIGGADSAYVGMRDVWEYPSAFETGTWYQRDSIPEPRWGADGSGSYVSVIACGATEQEIFHDDVWGGYSLTEPLPAFPAGVRRGGVGVGISGPQSWADAFYYGLGLDGDIMRRNDWWRLDMVVGIEEEDPINSLQVYPVPTSDQLTITIHPHMIGSELTISAIDGRVLYRVRAGSDTVQLATTNYVNGVYTISLHTAVGRVTQRFSVQH
ncbi:MAG: T9SS type A sorting domain-containing protein [Flavobacteriales bacterium]|nr:T9SS type A sorting domain-containing protein [Flavobacteriales bacterium]MBK6943502.1 T9SS type A sorting domain-containing protein [Flavobacteriales bacterium]MBK7240611.1 T9SS type A sorting domain-containing protein [Flavobacteriales bacterium]MBK7297292.1 T9SS type A sorting domain-containing protein [Flavobacteriales bacterium]MBK9535961.1 T9SS type A sorting domain-containing protein [Flavobacteriales bacterium]